MIQPKFGLPQGVGVGLRACHYAYIEAEKPDISWFEVVSDNYLSAAGPSFAHLESIRASYPITLHGVGMSLGSTDSLNKNYLKKLKFLIKHIEPMLVSDHLSWTAFDKQHFHELLPLPYTQEAVKHLATRIRQVQDYLERRIMIENLSSYLQFKHSTLTEWEFLQAVAEEADCLILLDINNIYVSSQNNGFNPADYLKALTPSRIAQFHIAGFEDHGTHLLDTHSAPVFAAVWELFVKALEKFGALPTIVEWDNHIPDFLRLQQEATSAQKFVEKYAIPT
jgi:hypothetical protein